MKKTRNKQKTIQLILESALKVFSEKGYKDTTINDIVSAVSLTKGAFYCHFTSKEELFLEIINYRLVTQQETFQQQLQLNAGLTDNIGYLYNFMLEKAKEENWVPLYIEFLAQSSKNEAVKQKMALMYHNWTGFLSSLLNKIKEAGLVSDELDVDFTSSALIAVFDGFNIQALVDSGSFEGHKVIRLIEKILS